MHHNVIIKDGDTTKAVKKVLVDGVQFVDDAPIEGSSNLVSSNGVSKAIADTKESVDEETADLQEQIDDIAEKAGSGYIPKGEASVATLNDLSGQENGELYTMTDAGTLTDGSLAVVAGDTVAWDATNSVWYKAMDYAPAQYGTNEVHNLATTATEADLVSGNYLAIDGSAGTKKLPAETLMPFGVDNTYDRTLSWSAGASTGVATYCPRAVPEGSVVSIKPKSTSGLDTYRVYPKGSTNPFVTIPAGESYFFVTPSNMAAGSIVVQVSVSDMEKSGGVVVGGSFTYDLEISEGNIGELNKHELELEKLIPKVGTESSFSKSQTIPAGASSGYILYPSQNISTGNFVSVTPSGSGLVSYRVWSKSSGFVTIPAGQSFSFTAVKDYTTSTALIQIALADMATDSGGVVVGGSVSFAVKVYDGMDSEIKANAYGIANHDKLNAHKISQFYTPGTSILYCEQSFASSGKVWLSCPKTGQWTGRLGLNLNLTNQTFADLLGKTLETSASGHPDCIPISSGEDIVIDEYNEIKLKNRGDVLPSDTVIFAVLEGKVISYDSSIFGFISFSQIKRLDDFAPQFHGADWATKQKTFLNLFNGVDSCEAFVFFTDPHFFKETDWATNALSDINAVKKWYKNTPTDFIICGGDLLQQDDTQEEALHKLGFFAGETFNEINRFYNILGNHDTNYQGVVSDLDSSRGDLSQGTLDNVLFGSIAKAYYKFEGRATQFYVLDTGIDWDNTMTAYRYAQLQWLATDLLTNDKAHKAVMMHIVTNSTANPIVLTTFSSALKDLINAFNSRQSITIDGSSYDFTNATGYIEFVLGGHSHMDNETAFDNVPYITTINTGANVYYPSFDLVFVDYTNNKINFVRIGQGNNRSFDLFSASL